MPDTVLFHELLFRASQFLPTSLELVKKNLEGRLNPAFVPRTGVTLTYTTLQTEFPLNFL